MGIIPNRKRASHDNLIYAAVQSKQASKQARISPSPQKKKNQKKKSNKNNKSILQQSRQASKKMLKQNSSKHNSLFIQTQRCKMIIVWNT
jgi:hypothetical protein